MSWESNYQTANFGGRDFWLVPTSEGSDGFRRQGQGSHTNLLRFDDPAIRDLPEYEYEGLRQDRKRIRLLKLYSGEAVGTKIYCELVEAEYDKDFHIPTLPTKIECASDAPKRQNGTSHSQDEEEGDRSDSEDRYKEMQYCEVPNGNTESTKAWERKLQKIKGSAETPAQRQERKKRQAVREMKQVINEGTKDAADEKAKEKQKEDDRFQAWKKVHANEEKYEALSWCWGNQAEDYAVLIKKGGKPFRKRVRKELAMALKYLRRAGEGRTLWIDAICINQADPNERNHQVQMMSRVYTRAQQVCIWLGEADTDSDIAIEFIKEEMEELKNFDVISSNEKYSRKWQALMSLMQRDWFFRRWVVQEIALASAATVYCGSHEIPWKSFAVAVELFVEVETATHRLSEVMKRDEKFRHVPGWFEYVSELGASLLVQATGKVFRTKRSPLEEDSDSSDDDAGQPGDEQETVQTKEEKRLKKIEDRVRARLMETQTIDPLERRSLLSLEYLVSTMFIFQASEPRDVVYSLLAIARDASPFAPAHYGQEDQKLFLVMTLLDRFLAEKPFEVDYSRPYSDVSRDFVEFSIRRTYKTDPHQALDILCRPWALDPPTGRSIRLKRKRGSKTSTQNEPDSGKRRLMEPRRREWKRRPQNLAPDTERVWENDTRNNEKYQSDAAKPDVHCPEHPNHSSNDPDCLLNKWEKKRDRYFPSKARDDIDLPSWVARVSQAPFMLDHAPGMDMRKTSRANADPLVGSPMDGHRNYNAAGSEKLHIDILKFKKRPVLGHYSLYVNGFELDTVEVVADASQLGSIPRDWLKLGGWEDLKRDPPDQFWRTIVADRGRDNRNPPYYYARACKESVNKGGHLGGSVNTAALINDEQNSIVAEFCRRVHAVIWNRCLFKTKMGRLGLASKVKQGDKVCILYGCTVPVILGQRGKRAYQREARDDRELESEEDRVEILKARIGRARNNRERRARYKPKKKEYEKDGVWEEMMDSMKQYLEDEEEETKKDEQFQDKKDKEKRAKKEQVRTREEWAKKVQEAIEVSKQANAVLKGATVDGDIAQDVDAALEDQKKAATAFYTAQSALSCNCPSVTAQKPVTDAAAAVQVADPRPAKIAVARKADKAFETALRPNHACVPQTSISQDDATSGTQDPLAVSTEDNAVPGADKFADTEDDANTSTQGDDTASVHGAAVVQIAATASVQESNVVAAAKGWEQFIDTTRKAITAIEALEAKANTEVDRLRNAAYEDAKKTVEAPSGPPATPSHQSHGSNSSQITPGTSVEAEDGDNETTAPEAGKEKWRDHWYEFKGECYLHGMMDGEAMREKLYKDLSETVFELR